MPFSIAISTLNANFGETLHLTNKERGSQLFLKPLIFAASILAISSEWLADKRMKTILLTWHWFPLELLQFVDGVPSEITAVIIFHVAYR